MARVAWLLATAARLSTGQILFHDTAASHISQLLNLGEDLGAPALQYFEGVRHGVLLEYRYSRILTLNPVFGQSPTNMSHTRKKGKHGAQFQFLLLFALAWPKGICSG